MNKPDLNSINLTQTFEELEKITQEFEQGNVNLDEGIPKFKRALELAQLLKKRLQEVENEIEEISQSVGEPTPENE